MADIIDDGPLNGFPLDLIQGFQQRSLRNGQRCRARSISALEQAAQYLAAARKVSIPALTQPLIISPSIPATPIGKIPVDLFSDIIGIYGFLSTDDERGDVTVRIDSTLSDQTATIPGTTADTIDAARRFFIPAQNIMLTKTNAPGIEEVELTLLLSAPATTATLWSLTIIVLPARVAP